MKHKEYTRQINSKNNSLAKDESLDGMEFTESNRIKKMILPDSFDIAMLHEIIRMRYEYGRFTGKHYITDEKKLHDLLYFYNYLDFQANIKFTRLGEQTLRRTDVNVDRNTAFAIEIVFSLASYGRLDHYKKLLTVYDNIDTSLSGELIPVKKDLNLNVTPCSLDREVIQLFNKLPIAKAAIIMASINEKKDIVVKHPDFKIIQRISIDEKACTVIKEKSNNYEIDLTRMPVFREQPEVLVIMLPVHNITEYFKFIRNYLRLTDSIETIEIIFHDSERIKKYKFGTDVDINVQVFIGWVVMYFLANEIVDKRPKIRNFGIYGYDQIDSRILAALSQIPLQSLSLLGADSMLDYFYIFKLFDSASQLKSNIQEFAGTFGAAVLLNQLVPERQLKVLRVSKHMQFKKTNIKMIKEDPCYDRLSAYFENRDLSSLPMACSAKGATKKLEVLEIFVFPPVPKFYSPADYNKTSKAKAEIAKEITVSEDEIQQMVTLCKPSNFNLIDIDVEKKNTNEAILTIENYDLNMTKRILKEVDLIKNKDVLIIEYLRPVCFKRYYTRSLEKKDLVDLLVGVFRKWIAEDKSEKHMLIFKVAETKVCEYFWRKIFMCACEKHWSNTNFEKWLKRVTFIKILK
ncbi:hypothetical protein ENBRE01_0103 [Enteropsectra breve]|nr:hypothetical protein ENBRE01_0103 [Enteropsectra breve]